MTALTLRFSAAAINSRGLWLATISTRYRSSSSVHARRSLRIGGESRAYAPGFRSGTKVVIVSSKSMTWSCDWHFSARSRKRIGVKARASPPLSSRLSRLPSRRCPAAPAGFTRSSSTATGSSSTSPVTTLRSSPGAATTGPNGSRPQPRQRARPRDQQRSGCFFGYSASNRARQRGRYTGRQKCREEPGQHGYRHSQEVASSRGSCPMGSTVNTRAAN
jgi:hypothetical protein